MMKLITLATLAASATAFAPAQTSQVAQSSSTSLNADFRSELGVQAPLGYWDPLGMLKDADQNKFDTLGLIGDGGSYSEGAAYGSDQSATLYSPYSVYGNRGGDALYKEGTDSEATRKKGYIAESQKRLANLPKYVDRKEWSNVKTELTRYMYETRGAVRGLATTPEQKKIAKDFFQAIEESSLQATLKNQEKCAAACANSAKLLDTFVGSL
jgi:photosystem II oxygen-evolving enhancer protein 3